MTSAQQGNQRHTKHQVTNIIKNKQNKTKKQTGQCGRHKQEKNKQGKVDTTEKQGSIPASARKKRKKERNQTGFHNAKYKPEKATKGG